MGRENITGRRMNAFRPAHIDAPKEFERDPMASRLWHDTIKTRELEQWTAIDLHMLTRVIKNYQQLEKLDARLAKIEDLLDEGSQGQPIVNPLFRVKQTLEQQTVLLLQRMALNASARGVFTEDAGELQRTSKRGAKLERMRQTVASDDDGLLGSASAVAIDRARGARL